MSQSNRFRSSLYETYEFIEELKDPIESLLGFNRSKSNADDWFRTNLDSRLENTARKGNILSNKISEAGRMDEFRLLLEDSANYIYKAKNAVDNNDFREGYIYWYYSRKILFDCESQFCNEDDFDYRISKIELLNEVRDYKPILDSDRKEVAIELLDKEYRTHKDWRDLLYCHIRGVLNYHDDKREKSNQQDETIRRLGYFVFVSLAVVITIALFSPLFSLIISPSPLTIFNLDHSILFIYSPLFGILGASFFGILTERDKFPVDDNSEGRFRFWFAIARVTVGAVAAIATLVFLQSEVLPLIINIDQSDITPAWILTLSFAAGYSERFFVGALKNTI